MTPLLAVEDLRLSAGSRRAPLPLVEGVSFSIEAGEAVGMVGESGAGKSLTASALPRLLPVGVRIDGGRILLGGRDLLALSEPELRAIRGRRIGYVGQDPGSALDPSMTVLAQVVEAVDAHPQAREQGPAVATGGSRALELLDQVSLPEIRRRPRAYPHELSGGQRQRVVLAMALAGGPELLVADEPTSALDVTLQAQFLGLLAELKARHGLALLLISHDLPLVAQTCDRILVLYAGRVVEEGPRDALVTEPRHPYTQRLLAASRGGLDSAPMAEASGPVSNLDHTGCRFHPSCPFVQARCLEEEPPLLALPSGGRARCWLVEEAPR